jgi:penicillin-binding protein 1B
MVSGLVLAAVLLFADARLSVRQYLEAPANSSPTTVWSAPIRIRTGEPYPVHDLVGDLLAAGYEQVGEVRRPGCFHLRGETVEIWTAAWSGGGRSVPAQRAKIVTKDGVVTRTEPSTVKLRPTSLGVLGDLAKRRTPVSMQEVAPWMVPALLAIEDARFHDHVGVDPIGITRALIHNLTSDDTHGGSTLTQQLAKNLFLDARRTMRRKIKEVFYAAALEAELDKTQLLELYLSEVYLGHSGGVPLYGVEQAARAWFGRSSARLSVAEAATIAGVISSPNLSSPLRSHERARQRRDQVLRRMVYVRALTDAQAAEALAAPLVTVGHPPHAAWRAPWAVSAALDEAAALPREPFQPSAGQHLHTTVQPHLQRATARLIGPHLARRAAVHPELAKAQAAVVALEVGTGEVLATVGGRDYASSSFHRAIDGWRQAGSTIKPLTALTALNRDATLHGATLLKDAPIERTIDGQTWRPANYDGRFLGDMPLRVAIEDSRNIPAVLLAERVGKDKLERFLLDAGLSKATDLPSASLGAFPVTAQQLAGAYAAFPARGRWVAPHVVAAIDDAEGRSVFRAAPTARRLADATTTDVTRTFLEGVVTHGTGRKAAPLLEQGDLGGKTGTSDEGRDAWFVGFDTERAWAVWVGRDRGVLGLTGGQAALPLWMDVVDTFGSPRGRFTEPARREATKVCRSTGRRPCGGCEEVITEWVAPGTSLDTPCRRRKRRAYDDID